MSPTHRPAVYDPERGYPIVVPCVLYDDPVAGAEPRAARRLTRPSAQARSAVMIFSMLRSASAVMVTNGFTPVLPGISEPSITYRPG